MASEQSARMVAMKSASENAATIIDNATYEKPHQYATGVEFVIVNGKVVLEHGRHSGLRPGSILLGPGKKL